MISVFRMLNLVIDLTFINQHMVANIMSITSLDSVVVNFFVYMLRAKEINFVV